LRITAAALLAALLGLSAAADRSRRIEYEDLPEVLRHDLAAHAIAAPAFGAYIDSVQADTGRQRAPVCPGFAGGRA